MQLLGAAEAVLAAQVHVEAEGKGPGVVLGAVLGVQGAGWTGTCTQALVNGDIMTPSLSLSNKMYNKQSQVLPCG